MRVVPRLKDLGPNYPRTGAELSFLYHSCLVRSQATHPVLRGPHEGPGMFTDWPPHWSSAVLELVLSFYWKSHRFLARDWCQKTLTCKNWGQLIRLLNSARGLQAFLVYRGPQCSELPCCLSLLGLLSLRRIRSGLLLLSQPLMCSNLDFSTFTPLLPTQVTVIRFL